MNINSEIFLNHQLFILTMFRNKLKEFPFPQSFTKLRLSNFVFVTIIFQERNATIKYNCEQIKISYLGAFYIQVRNIYLYQKHSCNQSWKQKYLLIRISGGLPFACLQTQKHRFTKNTYRNTLRYISMIWIVTNYFYSCFIVMYMIPLCCLSPHRFEVACNLLKTRASFSSNNFYLVCATVSVKR